MKQRREFKLTVVNKKTNTHGFLVVTHKKMLKEAVFRSMEDMRFLCRARNLKEFFSFATNLYEWQLVYYSRERELLGKEHYFQVFEVMKLYVKENNYQYGDNEMKRLKALMRAVAMHVHKKMQTYESN